MKFINSTSHMVVMLHLVSVSCWFQTGQPHKPSQISLYVCNNKNHFHLTGVMGERGIVFVCVCEGDTGYDVSMCKL